LYRLVNLPKAYRLFTQPQKIPFSKEVSPFAEYLQFLQFDCSSQVYFFIGFVTAQLFFIGDIYYTIKKKNWYAYCHVMRELISKMYSF
jgi:hypothetical protein